MDGQPPRACRRTRAPANVRTKLLASFLVIAALLVLVGALGLRFLGQANARVERLGTLQARSSQYQTLQTEANDLRQLLGLRVGAYAGVTAMTGGRSAQSGGRSWVYPDEMIAFALSQLGPSTSEATYSFKPPPADERTLVQIRRAYRHFAGELNTVSTLDRAGSTSGSKSPFPFLVQAIDAYNNLYALTSELATRTGDETEALIRQNRSAYTSSRDLFFAVGAASVALALGLGLILSWSLVSPIRRTEARLAEIAAGDFSGRLDVPNRDELGALAANVNRMNDELRRLYGELETASRHKSEFLANMSHELRTPLNAIIGFSQVLREQLFGEINSKQEEYLDDILASGHHLLSLINEVLDLSKVEAGQVELEVAPFSLDEALERGVVMVRERASKTGVRLSLVLDPEVDLVDGDERRFRQIVFNLLSNAVKFYSRRRQHRRCVGAGRRRGAGVGRRHRSGHRARGPGADLRGVPADRRRGRAGRGHGPRACALETARRAARRPDLGRERTRAREPIRVHVAARRAGVALSGEQILVVEDNEKNMKLFRDVLESRGYRTLEATSGEEAVELALASDPALVLMDVQLPGIDGVEALARLRSDGRTASIPVLALTAQAMQGDRERFLAAGFDGYISKPVDILELLRTVREHCDRD